MLALPVALGGLVVRGRGGGGDRVGGGVTGVTGDVGGCGRVTGGTGRCSGRCVIGFSGGGMRGKGCGARLPYPDLTARPGPRGLERLPGTVVFRMLPLEVREHALGAVGGPERQKRVILPTPGAVRLRL